jgi:4'-phosphopantetheinyl transferase
VHFFSAAVAARGESGLAADRLLLDGAERARADRFVFARDRETFTVAHALLRRVLSRYAEVPPRDFCFDLGPQGRPELSAGLRSQLPPLRFNLSHTHGLAAVAVTLERDIGVDVETLARPAPLEIIDHYFAPAEVAALRALPTAEQSERFFVYWTLKEAYIKARGLGLALPLQHFAFALVSGQPIGIHFSPELDDEPRRWSFAAWPLGDRYRAAIAVRSDGQPIKLCRLLEDDQQVAGVDAVARLDEDLLDHAAER